MSNPSGTGHDPQEPQAPQDAQPSYAERTSPEVTDSDPVTEVINVVIDPEPAAEATEATIQGLLDLNEEHDKKYGFIFIICATGKSAEEMLDALRDSLKNDPETELRRSATEENKITHLRLEKLLSEVS